MNASAEVEFGQLLMGGIGLMLLAAVALVMFVIVYQKRLLRQRTAEAEYQQHLLAAVIEAQERERERIGRDLHDGIGSTVATAKMLVNRLGANAIAPDATTLLGMIQEIMGTAVHDVRNISHSLYPAVLAHFGLAEALQHLVDVSNETGSLAIKLGVAYPRPLVLAQELALYRICQELIHNALKHARRYAAPGWPAAAGRRPHPYRGRRRLRLCPGRLGGAVGHGRRPAQHFCTMKQTRRSPQ